MFYHQLQYIKHWIAADLGAIKLKNIYLPANIKALATMKFLSVIISFALALAPAALAQVACCLQPGTDIEAYCGKPGDVAACVRDSRLERHIRHSNSNLN